MGLLSDSLKNMKSNKIKESSKIRDKNIIPNGTKEVYRKYILNNGKVLLLNETDFWSSIQYNIIEKAPLFRSLVLLPLNTINDEKFGFDCNLKFNNIGINFYKQPFQDAIFKVIREYTHISLGHKVKCNLVLDNKDADIEYHKQIFNMQRYLLDNVISNSILINNPELVGVSRELVKPSPGFLKSMTNFQIIVDNKIVSKQCEINSWVNVDEKSYLSVLADNDKKYYDKKIGDYKVDLGLYYELVNDYDYLPRYYHIRNKISIFIDKKYLKQVKESLHSENINCSENELKKYYDNNSEMDLKNTDIKTDSDNYLNSDTNKDDYDESNLNSDESNLNFDTNSVNDDSTLLDYKDNQDIWLDRSNETEEIKEHLKDNLNNCQNNCNQDNNQDNFSISNEFSDMFNSLQALSFDDTQSKSINDILNQTKQELLKDMLNQNGNSPYGKNNQMNSTLDDYYLSQNNNCTGDITTNTSNNEFDDKSCDINNNQNNNFSMSNNFGLSGDLKQNDMSVKKMKDIVSDYNDYLEKVKDDCEDMWDTLLDKINNVCMIRLKQDLKRNNLKIDRNNILDAMEYIYNQYTGKCPVDYVKDYTYDIAFKEAIGQKLEDVMTDYFLNKQNIDNIDVVDGNEILQFVDYTDVSESHLREVEECLSVNNDNYQSVSMSLSEYKDILTLMKANLNSESGFSITGSGSLIYKKYTNLYKTTDIWYKSAEEMIKSYIPKKQDSFQRLNKKYQSLGISLPSKCKRSKDSNIDNLSIFIDSSASMSDKDYIIFESIVQNSSKLFPKETKAFEFNTSLTQLKVLNGRILEKPSTTGGTDINCVLNKYNLNELKKTLNIVVSDGEFDWSRVHKFMIDNVSSKYMFIITKNSVKSNSIVIKMKSEINNKRLRIITVADVDKDSGRIVWGKS